MNAIIDTALWVGYYTILSAAALAVGLLIFNSSLSDFRKVAACFVGSFVILTVIFAPIVYIEQGSGCSSNETLITKPAGKTTVSKCVPDSDVRFLFD